MQEFEGRFTVHPFPNITNIFYGRDVGYKIERIDLDEGIEAVSGTEQRRKLNAQ